MFSSYVEKENACLGKPVIKESDIDRVRRNLSIPLQIRNELENNNNASKPLALPLSGGRCGYSPVTELAYDFTELAAHESSLNNTPRRRLSLASSSGSPTPDFCRTQRLLKPSVDSEVSTSSCADAESEAKTSNVSFQSFVDSRVQFGNGAFRRYNSMPFGGTCYNEASPMFNQPRSSSVISPLAVPQQSLCQSSNLFYLGGDEASRDSQDSGIDKDEDRFGSLQDDNRAEFVAPAVPPEKTQALNEQSPAIKRVSPTLFEGSLDSCDSPLQAHQLCGNTEDDDGFSDLDYLERQAVDSEVPASIANMLTGKMLASSQPVKRQEPAITQPHPITSFRGKLFRSPSMPQQLSSGKDYDIRRRVLCGNKRSEPSSHTPPTAVMKKRRGIISDGNLKPKSPVVSACSQNSASRLQRCRSMVEQSVSFMQSKGDTEGLTGDGKKCCLPLTKGEKSDLNNISHDTMSRLFNNEFSEKVSQFTVIDCRYPYEYNGGHIKGAENVYTKEDLYNKYLRQSKPKANRSDDKRHILIFHCEFSSERAPRLSRFLRNLDRDINQECYPSLFHPELYLLEGGYKVFHQHHKDLCTPNGYTPMLHKDFSEDLKTFRAKSKSFDEKRGGLRTCSNLKQSYWVIAGSDSMKPII
ncbi:M-phase inducer phosphatase 1-A-like isoform X2 [Watersipora subatra]|uniref:M-phase inducer phosphatase 1-A-like isoform X2 n=1 Tax=Watersipora subatra TaxID=2589382 RepID=UPI00355B7046